MPQKVYVTYNQVCRDLYCLHIQSAIMSREPYHGWSHGLRGDLRGLRLQISCFESGEC